MKQKIIFKAIDNGLHLSIKLAIAIGTDKDSDVFVAYCPFFDKKANGITYEEAKNNLFLLVDTLLSVELEQSTIFNFFKQHNFERDCNFSSFYVISHKMSDDYNCKDQTADLLVIDKKIDFTEVLNELRNIQINRSSRSYT